MITQRRPDARATRFAVHGPRSGSLDSRPQTADRGLQTSLAALALLVALGPLAATACGGKSGPAPLPDAGMDAGYDPGPAFFDLIGVDFGPGEDPGDRDGGPEVATDPGAGPDGAPEVASDAVVEDPTPGDGGDREPVGPEVQEDPGTPAEVGEDAEPGDGGEEPGTPEPDEDAAAPDEGPADEGGTAQDLPGAEDGTPQEDAAGADATSDPGTGGDGGPDETTDPGEADLPGADGGDAASPCDPDPCLPPRTCDPTTGRCLCPPDTCDVGDDCVEDGTLDPEHECRACSLAKTANGWTLLPAKTVCRPSIGICDPVEACDGKGIDCPVNIFRPSGYLCGAGPSECSSQDTCDGQGHCQANDQPKGRTCGVANGPCTTHDACDGAGRCAKGTPLSGETECGAPATTCGLADGCDGKGTCVPGTKFDAGTPCGDPATACSGLDTCDGSGTCLANHVTEGSVCGQPANDCWDADVCDAAGNCLKGAPKARGTACGSPATECSLQDTCDGAGYCLPNDRDAGATCGTPASPCKAADRCDGVGGCVVGTPTASGTLCGDAPTQCSAQDSCDGDGHCLANDLALGTECGRPGDACTARDRCDGSGGCAAGLPLATGTLCGAADTECSAADTCDGAGTCLRNDRAGGTACGKPGTDCQARDTCDGAGGCATGAFFVAGTYCGSGPSDCSSQDTCDGAGGCLPNHFPDMTLCDDGDACTEGDSCVYGTCRGGIGRRTCAPLAETGRAGTPFRVADSSASGYGYGYGPSMLLDSSGYRAWYCSSGTGATDWDHVRTVTSGDLASWSSPTEALRTSDPVNERATCDPSAVYFRGWWYLFYSGNQQAVQTVHFVARAATPSGPWLKWTKRGTWEENAADPAILRGPINATPDDSGWYGSGQATVVARDDALYIWYTDTTENYPTYQGQQVWMVRTEDPVAWPNALRTNLQQASVDVTWDAGRGHFVMLALPGQHTAGARVARYYSRDGLNWTGPFQGEDAPDWANNVGALRDKRGGRGLAGAGIVGYGAPWDLASTDVWGQWDLYAHRWTDPQAVTGDFDGDGVPDAGVVDLVTGRWYVRSSRTGGQGVPGIPWGWQWVGMAPHHRLALGDYDGDGVTDRCVVDPFQPGGATWYVIGSRDGTNGLPGMPWGWQWVGMTPDHWLALGDWDGDGKTDRAIVDPDVAGGGQWYILSSRTGGQGVVGVPGVADIAWGWQWPGLSRRHRLVLADYDGDRVTDRAMVDPLDSKGMAWYVLQSTTGQPPPNIPWAWNWAGADAGFTAIPADYDGDGKADRAVVGPASSGAPWYALSSRTGGTLFWNWKWRGLGDHLQFLIADWDGDGKADRTVVDADASWHGVTWFSLPSSGGPDTKLPWGTTIVPAFE